MNVLRDSTALLVFLVICNANTDCSAQVSQHRRSAFQNTSHYQATGADSRSTRPRQPATNSSRSPIRRNSLTHNQLRTGSKNNRQVNQRISNADYPPIRQAAGGRLAFTSTVQQAGFQQESNLSSQETMRDTNSRREPTHQNFEQLPPPNSGSGQNGLSLRDYLQAQPSPPQGSGTRNRSQTGTTSTYPNGGYVNRNAEGMQGGIQRGIELPGAQMSPVPNPRTRQQNRLTQHPADIVRSRNPLFNPRQKMASEIALELKEENAKLLERLEQFQREAENDTAKIRELQTLLVNERSKSRDLQKTIAQLETDNTTIRGKLNFALQENRTIVEENDRTLEQINKELASVYESLRNSRFQKTSSPKK